MDNHVLTGKRVLVIEDEMLVLMGIEDMLGDLGCTSITVAGTVQAGLDCIASNMFDLATVDVNLHGNRSYVIAAALDRAQIPFAFSTGYGEHGVNEGFGDRPVLNKPYSPCQFRAVIGGLLADGVPPALAA